MPWQLPQLIEAVKRGIMLAGGLPMDFPTISIHESFASPTSMYLRNLMSMDTEEMIRARPMVTVMPIGQWRYFKRNEAVIRAFLDSLPSEI